MRLLVCLALGLIATTTLAAEPASTVAPAAVVPQVPSDPPMALPPPTTTPIPLPRTPSLTEQLRLEAKRRGVERRLTEHPRQPLTAPALRDLGTLRRQSDRLNEALGR